MQAESLSVIAPSALPMTHPLLRISLSWNLKLDMLYVKPLLLLYFAWRHRRRLGRVAAVTLVSLSCTLSRFNSVPQVLQAVSV
jgi:hypothetical protein